MYNIKIRSIIILLFFNFHRLRLALSSPRGRSRNYRRRSTGSRVRKKIPFNSTKPPLLYLFHVEIPLSHFISSWSSNIIRSLFVFFLTYITAIVSISLIDLNEWGTMLTIFILNMSCSTHKTQQNIFCTCKIFSYTWYSTTLKNAVKNFTTHFIIHDIRIFFATKLLRWGRGEDEFHYEKKQHFMWKCYKGKQNSLK